MEKPTKGCFMNYNDSLPEENTQYVLWIGIAALVFLFFLWGLFSNESGITGILAKNDTLIAVTDNDQQYCSEDGGFTWGKCDRVTRLYIKATRFPHYQTVEFPETHTAYQYDDIKNITVSYDGKETWQTIYERDGAERVEKLYRSQTGNSFIHNWGAYYDPISGNAIFATGIDGIVLIDADENLHEISVGKYHPGFDFQGSLFSTLLLPYLLVALSTTVVLFAAIILSFQYNIFIPILVLQSFVIIVSPFNLYMEHSNLLEYFLKLAVLLNGEAFILFFSLIKKNINKYKINWQEQLGKALLIGLVYFLPYLLWYFQIIPFFWAAFCISIVLLIFQFYRTTQDVKFMKESLGIAYNIGIRNE
jgi:hypothetical protein